MTLERPNFRELATTHERRAILELVMGVILTTRNISQSLSWSRRQFRSLRTSGRYALQSSALWYHRYMYLMASGNSALLTS